MPDTSLGEKSRWAFYFAAASAIAAAALCGLSWLWVLAGAAVCCALIAGASAALGPQPPSLPKALGGAGRLLALLALAAAGTALAALLLAASARTSSPVHGAVLGTEYYRSSFLYPFPILFLCQRSFHHRHMVILQHCVVRRSHASGLEDRHDFTA